MESFPKKLEKFYKIWNSFGIISKKIGNFPNILELDFNHFHKNWKNSKTFGKNSKKFGIISKKVGKFPNNLEAIWNQFQENWKNSKTFGINFIVDLLQSLT